MLVLAPGSGVPQPRAALPNTQGCLEMGQHVVDGHNVCQRAIWGEWADTVLGISLCREGLSFPKCYQCIPG